MNPFKSRPRAACATLALAVTLAVAWVALRSRAPGGPGDDLVRLIQRLDERGLRLHVVPVSSNGDPRMGVYLCSAPAKREDLEALPHTPAALPRWRGVVFVGRSPPEGAPPEDGAVIVGSCQVFGDPEIGARIRRALGEEEPAGRLP